MVGGRGVVTGFVADSSNGRAQVAANKGVIDAFRSADIGARFDVGGEALFPDVEQLALLTDLLKTGIVVQDVFVKISGQYDLVVACLETFNKSNKIVSKVVARVGVRALFAPESCLLLVKGGNALKICWLFANLVYGDIRDDSIILALEIHVRPPTIFVAGLKDDASGGISLGNDGGSTWFVGANGMEFAAAEF